MSEGQKIWFIYLSDHHEGPFTVAEVAQKASQGLVTGKSLVWKDGMPEWVAAETVPEILAALSGGAPEAPMDPNAGLSLELGSGNAEAAGGEEPSLAQMLAQSQQQQAMEAPAEVEPLSLGTIEPERSASAPAEPGEHEQVWSMCSGTSVSGLFTMHTLKEMAGIGEIPMDARFWHPGITDFIPLAELPALAALRKDKKKIMVATQTNIARPRGLAPLVAGADVGNEDETDTVLAAPAKEKPAFLEKFKGFFRRSSKAPQKAAIEERVSAKKSPVKRKFSLPLLRPILMIVGIVAVGGAAAAVYFLLLASPVPDMEDVHPDDLEQMRLAVKSSEAGKLLLVRAVGDDVTPTFYVATNLAEGTTISLNLEGVSGTLVNALQFKKQYTAIVDRRQLAAFPAISDDSKPLPMGDYRATISAPGAAALKEAVFIGLAKKNHIYERRMAQYKQKLQERYDQEMQELKEYLVTEKSLFDELTKKITHNLLFKGGQAQRTILIAEWTQYVNSFNPMAQQLERKLKESISDEKFSDRIYPDKMKQLLGLIGQINQLVQDEARRVGVGNAPAPDRGTSLKQELEDLEKWVADAVMKSPIEVLTARSATAAESP